MKKSTIFSKINYRWHIWIWDRIQPFWLFHGYFKRYLLQVIFYKEINYARQYINGGYGDKYKDVRKLTDGHLNLFSGITFLEEGIINYEKYKEYVKRQEEMSKMVKEILEEA